LFCYLANSFNRVTTFDLPRITTKTINDISLQTGQNQIYIEYSRYFMYKFATKLPRDATLLCYFFLSFRERTKVFKLIFQTINQQRKACVLLTIHKGPKGKSTTRQDLHVSCILKRIFNYFTFKRYVKVLLVKFFVFIMLMDNIGQDIN